MRSDRDVEPAPSGVSVIASVCGSGRRSVRSTVESRASLVLDVNRIVRPALAALGAPTARG